MSIATTPVTSPGGRRGSDTPPPADGVRAAVRWAGDAVAVILLGAALVWFADQDGGRHIADLFPYAVLSAGFLPWAVTELRRLPRVARWLLLGLMVGGLTSIVFAVERSSFLVPAMTFSTVVVTGLAAHRVWRRRWGPAAILLLTLLGFGLYWQRSFLQWWGSGGGRGAQWLALSWHNQSATLMGAFGMLFLGVAVAGRRVLVAAGILGAGAALAGVWLSGSRGGLLAVALGLVIVTVVAVRARGALRGIGLVAASLAVTVAAVTWLSVVRTDDVGPGTATSTRVEQPLFEREATAGGNAALRLRHMEAALGMFGDRPITGQGLGSYRALAIRWSAPHANLPANAHNRYVEVLGEGGLVMGLPLLGLLLAVGVVLAAGVRDVRSPDGAGDVTLDEIRPALALGLAGGVAVIVVHSMIDFDWTYPVLPVLVAIGAGALTADRPPRAERSTTALSTTVVLAITALLTAGVVPYLLERNQAGTDLSAPAAELVDAYLPWQSGRGATIALELSDRGDHEEAAHVLDRVGRWSPGRLSLPTERAVVAYRAGAATAEDIADTLEVGDDWFSSFNLAASVLMEGGDHTVAQRVLRSAIRGHAEYPGWDPGLREAGSYELLVRSLAETGDCTAAREVAADAPELPGSDAREIWADRCA